jgi:hypothetical protein
VTVVAVGSVHGAPGVTALAVELAAAAPTPALLIEADPDGGCLAARHDIALKPGLIELAGAARASLQPGDLARFAQVGPHGCPTIVAHPATEQVHAALRAAAAHVGPALRAGARPVVVDVGRIRHASPALGFAAAATRLLVVAHNSVESIVTLTHRRNVLQQHAAVAVVLTSPRPYAAEEVERACELPVWGIVPSRPGSRRRRAVAILAADLFTVRPDDALIDLGHVEVSK